MPADAMICLSHNILPFLDEYLCSSGYLMLPASAVADRVTTYAFLLVFKCFRLSNSFFLVFFIIFNDN
jgi:hypothetical protein